jgi:catechol 2,3-dioxygenase
VADVAASLPADTSLGAVSLTVADLAGVSQFYEQVVGLAVLERDSDVVRLGPAGGEVLVELVGRADAAPRVRRSSGLFHLAILFPERVELARALRRVVGAGWGLSGASDHLVSEALYLSDPEGNGIELYRDRPRDEWRRAPDGGELAMATLPLDLDDLVAELPEGDEEDAGAPAGTRIGHVHLQVSDLAPVERFYKQLLGFEVTVRSYPGALFMAAGGYHHHVGANTWQSAGGPPADPAARGLRCFTIVVPGGEHARVAQRAADAGFEVEGQPDGSVLVCDPFRIGVLLRAAAGG